MEWVETTARTVEEAKELALDQLGVIADDAEFEVLDGAQAGPVRRVCAARRGCAPGSARHRPRPKQDSPARRARGGDASTRRDRGRRRARPEHAARRRAADGVGRRASDRAPPDRPGGASHDRPMHRRHLSGRASPTSTPSAEAAVEFVGGLTDAFGFEAVGRRRRRRQRDRGPRRRRRPRSADRSRRAHAAGRAGPRPGRRPAPPRRPRHPPARRRRRLPREAPARRSSASPPPSPSRSSRAGSPARSTRCRRPTAR